MHRWLRRRYITWPLSAPPESANSPAAGVRLPSGGRTVDFANRPAFFIQPHTSQPRSELLFKRKHRMFAPVKAAACKIKFTSHLFLISCNVDHAFFSAADHYDSSHSIQFAGTRKFLGYFAETFEDNILTFIHELFTIEKSSIKSAFYSFR